VKAQALEMVTGRQDEEPPQRNVVVIEVVLQIPQQGHAAAQIPAVPGGGIGFAAEGAARPEFGRAEEVEGQGGGGARVQQAEEGCGVPRCAKDAELFGWG